MPGPAPKPTALKLLTGNAGKRAPSKREPKLKAEKPRTPAHLNATAKHAHKGLCELLLSMGVLTVADGKGLELLCAAYAEWRGLAKIVKTEGYTYETTNGQGERMIKARPEVAMGSDAWKRVKSMIVEYGLTPSSRTRVETNEPLTSDPLQEFLSRNRRQ